MLSPTCCLLTNSTLKSGTDKGCVSGELCYDSLKNDTILQNGICHVLPTYPSYMYPRPIQLLLETFKLRIVTDKRIYEFFSF